MPTNAQINAQLKNLADAIARRFVAETGKMREEIAAEQLARQRETTRRLAAFETECGRSLAGRLSADARRPSPFDHQAQAE